MARTSLHDLLNEVAGGLQIWSSTFTAAASVIFPSAGNHLRVYNITTAVSNSGSDSEIQISDGDGDVIADMFLGAGKERKLDFRPFYWQVNNAVNILRPDDTNVVTVSIWYKEREDGHV
jgi:hypothetical protein